MEKIIELAKELARELQKTEDYKMLLSSKEINDNDIELQNLIGEFNMQKLSLSNLQKQENTSKEKFDEIQNKTQKIYEKIMSNKNMQNYSIYKERINKILTDVDYIINSCANGANPDEIIAAPACDGSCSSCGGCNH